MQAGANIATSATANAKTFASELEGAARKNPLGAMAGALLVGVLIGLLGRGRG
jgi:outer membrane lipoprotein SlyB